MRPFIRGALFAKSDDSLQREHSPGGLFGSRPNEMHRQRSTSFEAAYSLGKIGRKLMRAKDFDDGAPIQEFPFVRAGRRPGQASAVVAPQRISVCDDEDAGHVWRV